MERGGSAAKGHAIEDCEGEQAHEIVRRQKRNDRTNQELPLAYRRMVRMSGSNRDKDPATQPEDEAGTEEKPTGHPSDDRFETETAHHDVSDPDPGR
jgi:hypothetical protein